MLNTLILLWSEIYGMWVQGSAVLMTVLKNVDMHSEVYEPIWFKLGNVIDASGFCILILVWVTFILTILWESKKLYINYVPSFSGWSGWNLVGCCDLIVEPHTYFISLDQCSRERSLHRWFHKKKPSHVGLCLGFYKLFSSKLGRIIDNAKLFSLIPGWMALIFLQGLHLHP